MIEPGNVTDLYINYGGLYLLPYNITIKGSVDSLCIFGFINADFEYLFLNDWH